MDNKSEYYIDRFKSVVSSTNKVALLFLFTLTYVWFKSIQPNYDSIRDLTTLYNEHQYLHKIDSMLQSKHNKTLQKLNSAKNTAYNNSLSAFSNAITAPKSETAQHKIRARHYLLKNRHYDTVKRVEGIVFKRTINPLNRYIDTAITRRLQAVTSSLVKIDIPTLNTIEFKLNIAIPIWMALAAFLILYVYINRNIAFRYLEKGIQFEEHVDISKLGDLDIILPFWIHPFVIQSDQANKKALFQLIHSYNYQLYRLILFLSLIIILVTQFYTSSIVWNLNNLLVRLPWKIGTLSDYYSPISTTFCLTIFLFSVINVAFWLRPKKLRFDTVHHDLSYDFTRAQFIKMAGIGTGAIVAGILMSSRSMITLLPQIKGIARDYKRKRLKKVNKPSRMALKGFYINTQQNRSNIHYFNEDGKCLSLRTVDKAHQKAFASHLKQISILDYAGKIDKDKKIGMPYALFALEDSAAISFRNGKISEGLAQLKMSTDINIYSKHMPRAKGVLKREYKKYGAQLAIAERKQYDTYISSLDDKSDKLNDFLQTTPSSAPKG